VPKHTPHLPCAATRRFAQATRGLLRWVGFALLVGLPSPSLAANPSAEGLIAADSADPSALRNGAVHTDQPTLPMGTQRRPVLPLTIHPSIHPTPRDLSPHPDRDTRLQSPASPEAGLRDAVEGPPQVRTRELAQHPLRIQPEHRAPSRGPSSLLSSADAWPPLSAVALAFQPRRSASPPPRSPQTLRWQVAEDDAARARAETAA
jgi:hypothetical protein